MNQIVSAFRGVFANRDLRRVELAAMGSELAAFSYLVVLAVVAYDTSGTGGCRHPDADADGRGRDHDAVHVGVRRPLSPASG